MTAHAILEIVRLLAVLALIVLAAALATPKGRLPLALRGILMILKKDRGEAVPPTGSTRPAGVSAGKRLLAFLLVLVAIALSLVTL